MIRSRSLGMLDTVIYYIVSVVLTVLTLILATSGQSLIIFLLAVPLVPAFAELCVAYLRRTAWLYGYMVFVEYIVNSGTSSILQCLLLAQVVTGALSCLLLLGPKDAKQGWKGDFQHGNWVRLFRLKGEHDQKRRTCAGSIA